MQLKHLQSVINLLPAKLARDDIERILALVILSVRLTPVYKEGGVRACGDAVLRYFWCGFAVIFILICCIAVLKH